jgi:hypothetical protein
MQTPTLTANLETKKLAPAAQRMYSKILGKVRDAVIDGRLTAVDFQDAQADCLLYLSEVFGKTGMWA